MVNPKKGWERSDNLNKLLSLLKQHGELSFGDLKQKVGVSEPTLTQYIKISEEQEKIEAFFKLEDRRKRWYRIKAENREKVEAQLGKYEAIGFIERINDPIFEEREIEKGPYKALISIFGEAPSLDRKKEQGYLKQFLDEFPVDLVMEGIEGFPEVSVKGILEKHKIKKFALVFAFEKEGVVS